MSNKTLRNDDVETSIHTTPMRLTQVLRVKAKPRQVTYGFLQAQAAGTARLLPWSLRPQGQRASLTMWIPLSFAILRCCPESFARVKSKFEWSCAANDDEPAVEASSERSEPTAHGDGRAGGRLPAARGKASILRHGACIRSSRRDMGATGTSVFFKSRSETGVVCTTSH